ncbi:MAG: nitrilase-related carbon-nitrogen hydrolase, partial [Gemmatimonadales bacterium]
MPLLHLALAQFRPRKGDLEGNLRRIGEVLAQASSLDPRPQVVQFPETALSGYFVEGGVHELALTAGDLARRLASAFEAAAPGAAPLDVVIGFYERFEGDLHNSLMYVRVGCTTSSDRAAGECEIVHVHRKNFLPTYGMFDEERFVERRYGVRAFDAPWGRAAMLICEDAWHSLTGLIAALDGAHVIFVSSAAPARGTVERAAGDSVPGPVARGGGGIRVIGAVPGVFVAVGSLVGRVGGTVVQGAAR